MIGDLFAWQFWVGLLLGYFVLGHLLALVKSKVAPAAA
jgi:hypothetical protein